MLPLSEKILPEFKYMVAIWRCRGRPAVMFLCAVLLLAAAHAAFARGPLTDDPIYEAPAEEEGVRYTSQIAGVDDAALEKRLVAASQLSSLADRPPPTLVALERRARSDLERLQKVLRSEGYYDARVSYRIDEEQKPVGVYLDVVPGDRYTLTKFDFRFTGPGSGDPQLPRDATALGVQTGVPARAETVSEARRRLLETLADTGHPLAKVVDQSVVVDHADDSMRVDIEVAPGEQARFGPLTVTGADDVETDYIEDFVPWREGDIYDRRKVNQARQELLETGLFAAVAFERPNELDAGGELPMTVRVEERKHRSIGLGGRWSTDEGFSVEALWEHRNLFGREELLSLTAEIGEIKQEFSATFEKPRFFRPDQDLLAGGALANEDTDAFEGPLINFFVGLRRRVTPNWRVTAGIPVEFSNLEDLQGRREFNLFGLEFRGERDTSNDRLDPSAGSRTRFALVPLYGVGDNSVSFITGTIGWSGYHAIDDEERFTLAGRARTGSILGEPTTSLPANRRFYAGGGSSIRGYRFQSVGPLGPNNTPLGGRSIFELSAELRVKVTDTLGGVVFIDGGNVYDENVPDLSTNLQWAIGFGGRYFTTFGPIRVDFGFPLNPREGVDDFMQFYISIGQAF